MPLPFNSTLAATFLLGGTFLATSAACGTPTTDQESLGATSDLTGGERRAAACPAELQRCGHAIRYPDHGESSVEVRGDFGGQSTWENGTPMVRRDGAWTADIAIPFDRAIRYKFVIDGTTWKVDPAQPTISDGSNVDNTFAGARCESPSCEEGGRLPPVCSIGATR